MSIERPTPGRIVHYTLSEGEIRPAMVVACDRYGRAVLHVHLDPRDGWFDPHNNTIVTLSVFPSLTGDPVVGRWHWPKREQPEYIEWGE